MSNIVSTALLLTFLLMLLSCALIIFSIVTIRKWARDGNGMCYPDPKRIIAYGKGDVPEGYILPDEHLRCVEIDGANRVTEVLPDGVHIRWTDDLGDKQVAFHEKKPRNFIQKIVFESQGIEIFGWPYFSHVIRQRVVLPVSPNMFVAEPDSGHVQGNDVAGWLLEKNYEWELKGVDFRGGLPSTIKGTIDIRQSIPDASFRRGSSPLVILAAFLREALSRETIKIEFREYLGASPDTTTKGEIRKTLAEAIKNAASRGIPGISRPTHVRTGYETTDVGIIDFVPEEETKKIIAKETELQQALIDNSILDEQVKQGEKKAEIAAMPIRANGKAKAAAITAEGEATAAIIEKVGTARGKANAAELTGFGGDIQALTITRRAESLKSLTGTLVEPTQGSRVGVLVGTQQRTQQIQTSEASSSATSTPKDNEGKPADSKQQTESAGTK